MDTLQYCKSIRNSAKRDYAFRYRAWLFGNPDYPEYQCSYMAAQAVRMQLHEICKNAGITIRE